MHRRIAVFWTSSVLFVAAGGTALAADPEFSPDTFKPAVSGINGKLGGGYFFYDGPTAGSQHNGFVEGSFSAPLAERFGLQIDGLLGGGDLSGYGGVGAHVFWRDPAIGLLGLYGDYIAPPVGADMWRAGVEGEAYLDRFSVEGFAGYQDVSNNGGSFFTGDLTLAYYPLDNLRLRATVLTNNNLVFGRFGAEYLFTNDRAAPAAFADATFGNSVTTIKAGLRFYFGESGKSLIDRHREDDPNPRLDVPGNPPPPTPAATVPPAPEPPPPPPPPPPPEEPRDEV